MLENHESLKLRKKCPKRSFSDLYFPTFGLNSERYSVSLRIQSEFGKIHAVQKLLLFSLLAETFT